MKEWNDPFNPFNSMKVLMWRKHLEHCVKKDFLPPVTVDIDPANRCNYDCVWCLPAGTKVWTGCMSQKNIESMRVGDEVVGFEKYAKRKQWKLVKTKVVATTKRKSPTLVRIQTDKGTIRCTPEHRLWHSRGRWKKAINFRKGDRLKSIGSIPHIKVDAEFRRGWLAGVAAGDGCFWDTVDRRKMRPKARRQFRLAVEDPEILDRFLAWSSKLNFALYRGTSQCSERFGNPVIPALYLTRDKEVIRFEKFLFESDESYSYMSGFLGGIFDAEGSFSGNVFRIAQDKKHQAVRNRIAFFLDQQGFDSITEEKSIRVRGGTREHLRFFELCMPVSVRKKEAILGGSVRSFAEVLSVTEEEFNDWVYDIETKTHDFIAEGVRVHNCNAFDTMNQTSVMKMLPEDHLIKLADFVKEWGADSEVGNPKSACIAGGGEPLINPGTMGLLERMHHNELESGLITNGSLLDDEKIEIIARTCRWVGFSMDAGTPETYAKVKGITDSSFFNKVVENLRKLTRRIDELGVKNDVSYKYLMHPWNAREIYTAAKLAKEIGVRDFHLRPVGWLNITKTKNSEPLDFKPFIQIVEEQIEKALALEDDRFHFYGVRHKFNPELSPKKNFSRCWAIPILPTFGADGWVHTCFDMRGRDDLKMCKHYPDPEELARFWNSPAHHAIIDSIDINKCPRCTFTIYNEAVEKVIIKDKMCYKFP